MIKVNIRGDIWKIFVMDNDQFERRFNNVNAAAFTDVEGKQLFFNQDDTDLITVRHELFHCYAKYLYLKSATRLIDEDFEEIYAEMFAHEAPKILGQANYLYKLIKDM